MKMRRIVALTLTLVLCLGALMPGLGVSAADLGTAAFAREFAAPDNEYKPFVRWWISPGGMEETETRNEVKTFHEMGYGGVELVALGTAPGVKLNDATWCRDIKWILSEAAKYDMQVDVTFTVGWPIATDYITPENCYADSRTEQALVVEAQDFVISDENRTCTIESWIDNTFEDRNPWAPPETPPQIVHILDLDEPFELLAASAMKKITTGEGQTATVTYDDSNIIDLTDDVDPDTGALTWDTTDVAGIEDGDTWTVFYSCQQGTGNLKGTSPVLDPLSTEASDLVIRSYEEAFERDPELKRLYSQVGGSFFGDSFEMNGTVIWSDDLIETFYEQHGYDVTPYLPAIYARSMFSDASAPTVYEFTTRGAQARMDYISTISHMIADNHIGYLSDWAQRTVGMNVRYQAHCSNGSFFVDETASSLGADIPETESYALHDSLDAYRTKTGVVHLQNKPYSAEAAETHGRDWRETWTGSEPKTVSPKTVHDPGFMQYANRLFAAGVNMLVLHGASYHSTEPSTGFDGVEKPVTFPGASGMAGMNYPNEWDDKTPLFEYAPEMLDYLARAQLLLRQGRGDADLAIYRNFTTPTEEQAGPSDLNKLGWNYDYLTEELLELPIVEVGTEDGSKVLAPEGPSYKAFVIDQRVTRGGATPFTISVKAAEKILSYAEAGLPVVIVGDDPIAPGADAATATEVARLIAELKEQDSYIHVATIDDLDEALRDAGITPDADPSASSDIMFYHRRTDDADYYFMANDLQKTPISRKVTLTGDGCPYLLDGWSGEITPIAEYTAGDGTVTIDVDLAGGAQMLVAVAPNGSFNTRRTLEYVSAADENTSVFYSSSSLAAKTTTGGDHTVTLGSGDDVTFTAAAPDDASIGSWKMVLNQWKPMDENDLSVSPYQHRIVPSDEYTLDNSTGMKPWYEIDEANLLHSMGVAEYTTTVELTKGWSQGQGAILHFEDVSDTMQLTVNGTVVPVDQVRKDTDIGPWLRSGTNTIEVGVASSAANFKYARDWSDDYCFWDFGNPQNSMFDKTADGCTYKFGILGPVSLETYTVTTVAENAVQRPSSGGSGGGGSSGKPAQQQPVTPTEPIQPAEGFRDVPASAWYREPVDFMVSRGYMTGTGSATFAPDLTTNRAMVVTILSRYAQGQPVNAASFSDVAAGQWYADAVNWAVEKGIVSGYGDGTFGPNDPVTREQLAAILYRYAGSPDVSQSLGAYSDAARVSGYAQAAMQWCVANGILSGYTDHTLRPAGNATRAEMAKMFTVFIQVMNG